ncbi:MAG: DUF1295 domain-containing protein [Ilumatobacteraceae bacterium]
MTALVTAALVIAVLMISTWVVSLAVRNASIVDVVWGLGFVIVAWAVRLRVDGVEARQNLLLALTTIWGLRLAIYLGWRNHGKGEDFRYQAMRRHWGARFPIVSLLTVFTLQGVLMWIVSLPVQVGQTAESPDLGLLAALGVAVWAIGLFFESVGDAQLVRFKRNPANAGALMTTGLWRYTRHPNYFGDACVWWGIALVAAETTVGRWGLIGALMMNILLVRVSGVALLEKSLRRRKADYADYAARTSSFFPRPPRRLPSD